MLFGVRLANEVYHPWKNQYIQYDHLKKLLKESIVGDGGAEVESWTEQDETRFVEFLDKELEKVYSFEKSQYESISERLSELEQRIESNNNVDPKEIDHEVELLLDEASNLDRFRRLNFTGFVKIVKKHDRLHTKFQVKPLLHVRLSELPFHSEDYSPLLYRLSNIYTFLSENYGSTRADGAASNPGLNSNVMSSFAEISELGESDYSVYRFWVHLENAMEVKTGILRHLPALVYNREDTEDEEEASDPKIACLYFDNPTFDLYQSQLDKRPGAEKLPLLRLRWYGSLNPKTDTILEEVGKQDENAKVRLKEKYVSLFLRNAAAKGKSKYKGSKEDAEALQTYITENKLSPVMRVLYTRTAFEIPGDDRVRITLDNDVTFIREDSFSRDSPIRDPEEWHRRDLDVPNIGDPLKYIRKYEYSKFPYAIMEIRVKTGSNESATVAGSASLKAAAANSQSVPSWVDELINSDLVQEVPMFSRYVQGIASLFAEDDRLGSLPFWLSDIDNDAFDNRSMIEVRRSEMISQKRAKAKSLQGSFSRRKRSTPVSGNASDEEESTDEETPPLSSRSSTTGSSLTGLVQSQEDAGRLDVDSEEEELALPPGVARPKTWLKNSGAVKVETKVWLANERTFNKWLHITTLMSALTFTLYSSVKNSTNEALATYVAYALFALTLFTGLWGYGTYMKRLNYIKARSEQHLDSPFGPLVVSVALLLCLIVNFTSIYYQKTRENAGPVGL